MPVPVQRDLAEARVTIQDWMARSRPGWSGLTVSDITSPGTTGYSNETLMFDALWTEDGSDRLGAFVVRVKPTGFRIFLEDNFETQFRVMSELSRRGAAIPAMHAYESDDSILGAPFFLMGRERGQAPGDAPPYNAEGFIFDMEPGERHRLWRSAMDAFTRIHQESLAGGFDFVGRPELGGAGVDQQLEYYRQSLEWAAAGRSHRVAEAAWEWLEAHRPESPTTALSWGDARMANMLFDGTECRAVLDWEMLSLGGPEMDLGWWLFLDRFSSEGWGLDRLEGLGTRQETIDLWSERTGLVPRDLEFYEIFAGLRFSVVMIRMATMFAEWGLDTGFDIAVDNGAGYVLARMLDIEPPKPFSA